MSLDRLGGGGEMPTGSILQYAASSAPTNWLLCSGASVSRLTYANLFNLLVPSIGNQTFSNGSSTITLSSHGLVVNDGVMFTSSGSLPTNFTANQRYYVKTVPTSSTFTVSSTIGGSAISAGSAGSGTHTLYRCPYGIAGDGNSDANNFLTPDLRGKTPVCLDNLGTSQGDGGILSVNNALGYTAGEENHTLTTAEMPAHNHGVTDPTHAHYVYTGGPAYSGAVKNAGAGNIAGGATDFQLTNLTATDVQNAGSNTPHNNMQPYILTSYIIKT